MNEYRVEAGRVYEYDAGETAYIFIGCLNGKSLQAFIRDYEMAQLFNQD